jgi:uroporphyrinogen decarboxylase
MKHLTVKRSNSSMDTMTPRERVYAAVRHKHPDRIPWTLNFGWTQGLTPQFQEIFSAATGIKDYNEFYNFDIRPVDSAIRLNPVIVEKLDLYYPVRPDNWGWDFAGYGVMTAPWPGIPYAEMYFHPLAKATTAREVENFPKPLIDSAKTIAQTQALHRRDLAAVAYSAAGYELCWLLRGMEQFMIDLVTDPIITGAVTEWVTEVVTSIAVAHAKAGVDILAFYDDTGTQEALQISPRTWRKWIRPIWARVLDATRQVNSEVILFMHSCGMVADIVPDFLDCGIEVINVQPELINPAEVKKRFGQRVCQWGTISAQRTLPCGTPEDVRAEVRERVKLGQDGGLILSPSNTIGPEVPVENVLAFIDAAREYTVIR